MPKSEKSLELFSRTFDNPTDQLTNNTSLSSPLGGENCNVLRTSVSTHQQPADNLLNIVNSPQTITFLDTDWTEYSTEKTGLIIGLMIGLIIELIIELMTWEVTWVVAGLMIGLRTEDWTEEWTGHWTNEYRRLDRWPTLFCPYGKLVNSLLTIWWTSSTVLTICWTLSWTLTGLRGLDWEDWTDNWTLTYCAICTYNMYEI